MRAPPRRGTQIRIVLEDPLVEIGQQGARFEPELVDEPATSMSVCLECLDLTARLVERKHQLAHQPLAERIGIGCSLQFGYELVATAELELRVCPRLERTKPFLLERRKLSAEGCVACELRQNVTAPQRQSICELLGRHEEVSLLARATGACDEPAKAQEIELIRRDTEPVTIPERLDSIGAEHLPEVRDTDLQRVASACRRVRGPERVDQPIGRNGLICAEQQKSEYAALLGPRERQHVSAVMDDERSEQSKLHCCSNRVESHRQSTVS